MPGKSFGQTINNQILLFSWPVEFGTQVKRVFWVLVSFSQASFRGKNNDFDVRKTQANILIHILPEWTWRSYLITVHLNFLMCKMQTKSSWDPSEDDMCNLYRMKNSVLDDSVLPQFPPCCLFASPLMGMWTRAKLSLHSVVALVS